jgi:hypothetical protein
MLEAALLPSLLGINPMSESFSIDKAAIRAMVEDFWRSFIAVARNNPKIGGEIIEQF